MATDDRGKEARNAWRFSQRVTERWVDVLTYAILGAVTSVVTAVVTAITIVFVVLGGLWLAYRYLPSKVFTILAVVLAADILLGIAVRAYRRRS